MRKEFIELRINYLKQFDHHVREVIANEAITDIWITYGLQGKYDDNILYKIAEENSLWQKCVECFYECYRLGYQLENAKQG